MNKRFLVGLLTGLFAMHVAAEHDGIEEIVVTGPFHELASESALPVGVLTGEELKKRVSNSIGDTLKNENGVHSASFGPGVGLPVIRGQSGKRVQVLQNSVFVSDAANLSQDHANGIEPVLADSIEVVRGPATLLYGSGAIGGVINVVDQRIPTRLVEKPVIVLEQSHNSVSDENRTVFGMTASHGEFGFHLDAYNRRNEDVNIEGFATDEEAVEALEELAGEEHEEEEEEEGEAVAGYIPNSEGEAEGGTVGFSWVRENGFIGFSYNKFESEYGLPPGAHGHHHEEEEEEEEEEHEEDVLIRLALEQERYDFKGDYHFNGGYFDVLRFHVGYTDYEHAELEIEEGEVEVGTLFDNEGYDSRFTLTTRERADWRGVYGAQINSTDFSAVGEEAFIPETDIDNFAVFGVERWVQADQTIELAARIENSELDSGACDQDETVFSVSGSLVRDLSESGTVILGLGRSERAPTVEERFSNIDTTTCGVNADLVTHAATNLIEIGSANLDTETSVNLDVGYRFNIGGASGEVTAFYNDISDYIYLELSGTEVDETQVANFVGEDAEFYGIEALIDFPVYRSDSYSVIGTIRADMVRGEFSDGTDVPRVPPARVGFALNWAGESWTAEAEITRVFEQSEVGPLELPTEGYTLVNLYTDYHWNMENGVEFVLFAKAENVLDEQIRNHVSFLKNTAPEPGRGIRAGFRLNF